ncbi:hypothetical protein A9308_05540 [Moraxella atlantae]|uniref:Uncharacterized protein n=1 Tax=Faucicola atlantae TaxID=34059 RepID=A0A1B8QH27_9GAMM|nr:hypothetical protein A9308_05540 [Moraxella atlantae]OBX82350.1 hypothetical protein A9306_00425 [Moraxella atlantae]OPH33489.1 hypothetical protein B5J92_09765 [Moraxella atlantae]
MVVIGGQILAASIVSHQINHQISRQKSGCWQNKRCVVLHKIEYCTKLTLDFLLGCFVLS